MFQSQSDESVHIGEKTNISGRLGEAEMFLSAVWTAVRNAIEVQGTACWFETSSSAPCWMYWWPAHLGREQQVWVITPDGNGGMAVGCTVIQDF